MPGRRPESRRCYFLILEISICLINLRKPRSRGLRDLTSSGCQTVVSSEFTEAGEFAGLIGQVYWFADQLAI